MIKELTLPNGYAVRAVAGSEPMIEEIWSKDFYGAELLVGAETVLDIGANQGFFSLLAAHHGARVFAYEPMPQSYSLLVHNASNPATRGRIVAYEEAVGAFDGERDLYVPDSTQLVPTGNVTTNQDVVTLLKDVACATVSSLRVRCVTLETALARIAPRRVDLLKMDCEGAELEILESAHRSALDEVENLVMETHDAYPERVLYELVQDLGFRIKTYEKRAGAFRTGFLCARRSRDTQRRMQPVAILSAPALTIEHEPVTLDASRSFAALRSGPALLRRWALDDTPIPHEGDGECVSTRIETPGPHRIRLTVSQGDLRDEAVASIFCLTQAYQSQPVDEILEQPRSRGGTCRVHANGTKAFKIPSTSLLSMFGEQDLEIAVQTLGADIPRGSYCEFNGQRLALAGGYNQHRLAGIPRGLDVVFTVFTPAETELDVYWWPVANSPPVTLEEAPATPGVTNLAPFGAKKSLVHDDVQTYAITASMLPESWLPREAVIGISANEPLAHRRKLAGSVSVRGHAFALEDWYTEIRIPLGERTPVEIEIDTLGARRELLVAWWAE